MTRRNSASKVCIGRKYGRASATARLNMRNSDSERSSALRGDIKVYVRAIDQLFHTLDPSPFYDRDLDEKAEEFIIGSAEEHPHDVPLALTIVLDRPSSKLDERHV